MFYRNSKRFFFTCPLPLVCKWLTRLKEFLFKDSIFKKFFSPLPHIYACPHDVTTCLSIQFEHLTNSSKHHYSAQLLIQFHETNLSHYIRFHSVSRVHIELGSLSIRATVQSSETLRASKETLPNWIARIAAGNSRRSSNRGGTCFPSFLITIHRREEAIVVNSCSNKLFFFFSSFSFFFSPFVHRVLFRVRERGIEGNKMARLSSISATFPFLGEGAIERETGRKGIRRYVKAQMDKPRIHRVNHDPLGRVSGIHATTTPYCFGKLKICSILCTKYARTCVRTETERNFDLAWFIPANIAGKVTDVLDGQLVFLPMFYYFPCVWNARISDI